MQFKPGVDRENTRYTTEGGWYETEKVRFRFGLPEKIGGWERLSESTFLGVCRALWNWVTLAPTNLMGAGTNIKYYIEKGGAYYDITPLRATTAAGDVTFAAVNGDATITVTDTAHGAAIGDFVTFSGAATLGGNITDTVLNQEYEIATIVDDDNYTVEAKDTDGNEVLANGSDTGNGGASVVGAYQINIGAEFAVPFTGFGAGTFGGGTWGVGGSTVATLRQWSHGNFGEDLIMTYRGASGVYLWDASVGTGTRAKRIDTSLATPGAADADYPEKANFVIVSDIFRFIIVFGCDDYSSSTLDPMLIRWCEKEDLTIWTPAATNEAGSLRLSRGSEIVTAIQARQEILVLTDSALYGMQYLGAPEVWGAQLLGDNISVAGQNAAVFAANTLYWMGVDKFYMYDGTVKPLPCRVRKYVFNDYNLQQQDQVFAGINESFNEVWWFYPSSGSTTNDKYVVYNYLQDIWYYGNLARTAWVDNGLRNYPTAATYSNNLVYHEKGLDDKQTASTAAITASVTSSQFDLDDGHQFMFIDKMLPDVTFDGSTADSPALTITLQPLKNSGAGRQSPASEGGNDSGTVTRSATVPVETFTGENNVRIRGRQMSIKVESTAEGVAWQLGSPRFNMRPDGRRG